MTAIGPKSPPADALTVGIPPAAGTHNDGSAIEAITAAIITTAAAIEATTATAIEAATAAIAASAAARQR